SLCFELKNFLEVASKPRVETSSQSGDLFDQDELTTYDLIIANPPYVRTQILGSNHAQEIARQFNLSGRVDLYHAFILGISNVLDRTGVAGIIVSNRFMTTRAGVSVRRGLYERYNLRAVWDFGDTKLFDAAVLPAVLLLQGKNDSNSTVPTFQSIYETTDPATSTADDVISALSHDNGVVKINDGRRFKVKQGTLDTGKSSDGVWRVATQSANAWLKTVDKHTWATFRDIGKIRVGVKTCADKIFIRSDWEDLPESVRPELLRPITTHHVAKRFTPKTPDQPKMVVYPHEVVQGKRRAVNLEKFPRTKAYLESHRSILANRKYLNEAGRDWYEIWVPQDPRNWDRPKLVFRDITEKPTFWMDLKGTVVNGDCYWMVNRDPAELDLLWLSLAVANSTFAETFYDLRFHNKLYSGRRRFMTQYVENFPLPSPHNQKSKEIVSTAKEVYRLAHDSREAKVLQERLDTMVWVVFLGEKRPIC
ncbi:MAG: N-6 DNA methylase, partial [Gammaproteobacteria bacterium]|nr:N-6 DNA methylase [Gammaproteobacteria bacterium]